MTVVLVASAAVACGLALLAVAADRFVDGAASLALRLAVPTVLVGAVVVGFGTSAPELVVSSLAARAGSLEIATGNIVGSNLANLTLVLGVASIVAATAASRRIVRVELPLAAAATVAFAVAVQDGLTRTEGGLLAGALAIAVVVLVRAGGSEGPEPLAAGDDDRSTVSSALLTVAGLAGVLAGAQLLVWGSQQLAGHFGLGEGLVGLTLVALGTSAPELATGITAARRGHHDLLVGNVLGSNVLNSLAVGAAAALIGPGRLDAPGITGVATVAMLAATVLVGLLLVARRRIGRAAGVVLVVGWAATVPLVA